MSHLDKECKECDFKWGKIGRKSKTEGVKFYESFTYDGIEYFLYDCIYLYVEDEPEPYIGKLVKIWEQPNGEKKVKVVWFFRKTDLLTYLKDYAPLKNEIFLAFGEGDGLFNINDLRVINGKCNVVCTSMDERNPQPSKQEIERADYIFSRTFDVGKLRITDKIKDDAIAGIDVRYFFNWTGQEHTDFSKTRTNTRDIPQSLGAKRFNSVKAVRSEVKDRSANCIPGGGGRGEEVKRTSNNGREHEPLLDGMTKSRPKNGFNNSVVKDDKTSTSQGRNHVKLNSVTNLNHLRTSPKPSEKSGFPQLVYERKCSANIVQKPYGSDVGPSGTRRKAVEALHGQDRKKVNHGEEGAFDENHELTKEKDRSKWFNYSWEEQLEAAYQKRTLVLFKNLDPSYSSEDVQDIVGQAFEMNCTAKMMPRNAFSSPLYGQAFAIFKSREDAQMVIDKLQGGCCILDSGRPLLACHGIPREPEKQPKEHSRFTGHLTIEEVLRKQSKEKRDAVSTSHFTQPNTIEYDMAVEWIRLQKRSDLCWKELHEQYEKELNVLRSKLNHR